MSLLQKTKTISFVVLLVLCFSGGLALAEELSLEQAISHALLHSPDLEKLQDQINSIEQEMLKNEVGQDWQINMNLGAGYSKRESNNIMANEADPFGADLLMTGSRTFPFGLSVKPEVSLDTEDMSPTFRLKINQSLFPFEPTESQKSAYKLELEHMKAIEKLRDEEESKMISWVESYLNILRLQERIDLAGRKLELAQSDLEEVQSGQKIGEGGQIDLLTAQMNLQQAEYDLRNLSLKLQESIQALYLSMNLAGDQKVQFIPSDSMLKRLQEVAQKPSFKMDDSTEQMGLVKENNYQLLINQLDQELLSAEIEWFEAEQLPQVDFTGNYYSETEEINLSVNLTYNLYDSGLENIKRTEKEENLAEIVAESQRLWLQLELELEKLHHQLELDQMALTQAELKFDKLKTELDLTTQQFNMGLIEKRTYINKKLQLQEAEVNLNQARDQLFLSQLRVISFVETAEVY